MKSLEVFLESNHRLPESRLVECYKTALVDAENSGVRLSRYLRIKDGKPVYAPGVDAVAKDIETAGENLERIKSDIRSYLELIGEYDSVQSMLERLLRLKRTVDNVNRDLDNITKQTISKGIERPQDDPAVQAATDKRDRVVSETATEIQDLSNRIAKAKELVGRY